jgi:hypothetical protein
MFSPLGSLTGISPFVIYTTEGRMADLARIDDRHRQAGVRLCGGDDGFVSFRRFSMTSTSINT